MKALNTIPTGRKVVVRALHLSSAVALRLQALGMTQNTPVTVLQRKGRGTMILDLRGTRFALGDKITSQIEVDDE